MRRTFLAVFSAVFLLLGLTLTASAQADLGNDGVDTDCNNNFFTSTEQARAYFADDGGSIDRNVDDLDRDRDGTACDAGITDVGGNGSQFPGGGSDDGTDDGSDDGASDDGTDDGSDDGASVDGSDDGETSELPDTGTGPAIDASVSTSVLMLATIAVFLALAGLRIARR